MSKKNEKFIVRFSRGTGRNFGRAKNAEMSLRKFKELFRNPVRTAERFSEYIKLPEKDQGFLKASNGWFYRTQVDGGRRNRGSGQPSDMVTLDFDYASVEFFEEVISGTLMPEWEWFLQTSRRHTDDKPRFRLFIFLEQPVPNDLYGPVSRIIAQKFDPDMQFVDKVSFRPAQMMFMPTTSKDGDFTFHENNGDLVDWSGELDIYEATVGDWRDITKLPQVEGENARQVQEKAEIPTDKEGPVGNFCRAYDIHEAIEAFNLPYEAVDDGSAKPRYTYTGGTTTNGAEVQDGGLFLYSHHGSDPASDMLVNSFDLVRIHRFADLDEKAEADDLPIGKRPSFTAMLDMLKHDAPYMAQVVASRYDIDAMNADFDLAAELDGFEAEVDEDYDPEVEELIGKPPTVITVGGRGQARITLKRKRQPEPEENWMQKLQMTKDGIIIANTPNVAKIIQSDKRTRNALAYNEFTDRVVIREPLRTRMDFIGDFHIADPVSGDSWEDIHTTAVRAIIESANGPGLTGYGFKVPDRDMEAGIELAARKNSFHPVREYFDSLSPAPKELAETLFIRYLGCPDTPYHREAAMLFLLGAVTRIYEPGAKFDFVPILAGAQGKRKSTFCRLLACGWHGELKANFSDENKLVEQMVGSLIMEIPELGSISRSQVEDSKAFVSGTESNVRLAWGRRSKVYKRQCVFIGSTNDDEFLLDTTGNRRWWPIKVEVETIDTDKLILERDQIWGAAVQVYREMRISQPSGPLDLSFRNPDAIIESQSLQERARVSNDSDMMSEMMLPWLDAKVTDDENGFGELVHRAQVTASEVWYGALGQTRPANRSEVIAIGKAILKCGWFKPNMTKINGISVRVFRPELSTRIRWKEQAEQETGDDMI